MQRKRMILGALALILTLCFISSSAILIDNNESGQEIALSAPEPSMESDHYYSYIICIGDVEHRYADIHYVASTSDTILDGVLSIDEYNSLVNQGYVFEYRIGSKTGSSIDFHTAENLGYYGYSEIYVIASLPPGTLSDDGTRLIQAPSNATEFMIPESVNTVAGYAFFKCNDLKSITFPESVKTLEPHTFDGLGQDITVSIPWSATYMDAVPPFFNIVRTGTPPLTHTVTFNTNGGNEIASQIIEDGKTATKPAMPEKHGYYFMGWYSDEALTSSFSFSSEITADTTLYAKWVPAIYLHIKVLDDGGQTVRKGNASSSGLISLNYDGTGPYEDTDITDDMIKYGFTYLFHGTTVLDAFRSFEFYFVGTSYVTSDDVRGFLGLNTTSTDLDRKVLSEYHQDVYATYKNNHWYIRTNEYSDNYTVSFDTNGGSAVASQTVAIDSVAVKPADPTKDNLMFMGWYSDVELTSKYNFNSQVSANITLYAKWAERTYPAPTADNYSSSDKFEIYTADEMVDFRKSIDSTRHYDGKIVYLARDIEMSGIHYDFPDTFNGTFDGQGHVISGFKSNMASPLFRIIGSNGIVKNLGIFNAQVSGEGSSNAIMAEVNNGSIVNCYANECSVSWGGIDSGGAGFVYSNHGSIENCYSNISCLKDYNTLCAGNNGTVTNSYYLQGSRQPNEIGVAKTAEEMKDPSFATLLGNAYAPDTANVNGGYPILAPVSAEFTVEFDTNGGSEVESQIVIEGENAVRPADPTKQGYVFGGWYVDAALTNEYTFTTAVSSNITLYAKWYENLVFTSVPSISDIKITIDGRTISASVAADHYLYILWDLGNGETIKTYSNKLAYTYADDGEYIIKATAINSEGSSETVEYNVNIENNKEQELQSLFIALILFAVILIVAFILIFYITGMFIVSTIISPIIAIVIVSVLWFLGAL